MQPQHTQPAAAELVTYRSYHQRPGTIQSQMGSALDDIPFYPIDAQCPPTSDDQENLELACRSGDLSQVQSVLASITQRRELTPLLLYPGLVTSLGLGHVDIVRFLFTHGAVITRAVPSNVLRAPSAQRMVLFEVLEDHGWTPNYPGYYGEVLMRHVVTDMPLLRWFLDHGADPNLGEQRFPKHRFGAAETNCDALEAAAYFGSLEAVRALLDAGAQVAHGVPLHSAAAAVPGHQNIYQSGIQQSAESDADRIPIMALLVEKGADVNQLNETPYRAPRLAILLAVMANAVARVRWLLEHGADPTANGSYGGTAAGMAQKRGSEEMKKVMQEGLRAQRWKTASSKEGSESSHVAQRGAGR
ncbi:MAG: hypothetical protein M1828_007028 [Chrysothrix sp. TS-e1954]|nr:MAG: hypothetical protein M1828_007028 [Chrysothrix sp. TS-e1954]